MIPDDSKPIPIKQHTPEIKKGTVMPNVNLTEEVADDLRAYIFNLIDSKLWAGRNDREIVAEIIGENIEGTEEPRFYSLGVCEKCKGNGKIPTDMPGDLMTDEEVCPVCHGTGNDNENKIRLKYTTTRAMIKSYRHRSLEIFKEDLMPYIQEAVVEVIKTAGKKPSNLKMILEALELGKEVKQKDGHNENTPSSAYIEVRKRIGVVGDAAHRTGAVIKGLRALGHESVMRDDTSERRRPPAGVVPRRDDPGMDAPPNIIEVDGGPYAFTALPSEDDVLDYGREYLGDTEEPGYGDSSELSGVEVDEESDAGD